MDIWEYQTIRMQALPDQLLFIDQQLLQRLGSEGWEMVGIVPISQVGYGLGGKLLSNGYLRFNACDFVFKRRK
jgi:hypothetical protein